MYSPSSSSKPVWMSLFCRTQRKIFWRMWETEQFFHSIFFPYYGSQWCPKTAWLQTFFKIPSFVFGRTKKFIQVWNYLRVSKWWQNFHFWVNYPFNHTSLYFNINWIGPRMILKECSAVAVVTKLVRIWLTDKLHAFISVLFFILWIFQLTVWFVHSAEQHSFKVKDCPRWLRMLFQILLHHRVPLRLHSLPKKKSHYICPKLLLMFMTLS